MTDAGHPALLVGGDLDYCTAPALWAELHGMIDQAPHRLTLDVADLRFVDSTGLAVIVQAWRACQESGTVLGLRTVPRFLESILRITGVAELLARQSQHQAGQHQPVARPAEPLDGAGPDRATTA
ncbi:STAS domain-containing protein [Plantactinospora sp. KBS50]|uniref:STAS domain-containing protein n=1 Tax=Plantactinospora sp. KBS50 TaxID=2024580 RepID=UPI001E53A026|nr:STAS domain-containing protein [Plantactinospora sp. KBS50]